MGLSLDDPDRTRLSVNPSDKSIPFITLKGLVQQLGFFFNFVKIPVCGIDQIFTEAIGIQNNVAIGTYGKVSFRLIESQFIHFVPDRE
jgi:hypothetical protein